MTPDPVGDQAPAPPDRLAAAADQLERLRADRLELEAVRADLDARPVPTPRPAEDPDEDPTSWISEYREMKSTNRRHWRETHRRPDQAAGDDGGDVRPAGALAVS